MNFWLASWAAKVKAGYLGVLHSIKTSTLNFRQLPVANGTVFFKTSKTWEQPREVYPIFENVLTEDFFPFIFAPGISRKNVCMNRSHFGNSTASEISRNFSRKVLYHLPPFPNFWKFRLNGKRPLILCTINFIAERMNELLAHFVSRQSQGGLVKYHLL